MSIKSSVMSKKCPNKNFIFIVSPYDDNKLIPDKWVWCACHVKPSKFINKPKRKLALKSVEITLQP